MSIIEFAKQELDRLPKDPDNMQNRANAEVLEILETLANQGHSGLSIEYTMRLVNRLMLGKPLTALTGDEDEWYENQNIRCSSVFRDSEGNAYDHDSAIVSDNGGITWFASKRFYEPISFPYNPPSYPKKVYIEYTEDVPPGYTSDEYEIITDKPERIKALYERKRKEFDEVTFESDETTIHPAGDIS